jgi:Zn ribbon nucleic-acid-binding protein
MDSEFIKKGYNKARKRDMMKLYFENNKDVRIECGDCGKFYSIFNSSHHKNSKYHQNVINFIKKKQLI